EKIGFDLKKTLHELHKRRIDIAPPIFDIGVAAWLIDPNRKSYSVEDLSLQYLNRVIAPNNPYLISDLALQLKPVLMKRLEELELVKLFSEMEMELLFVLTDMEERGIKLDIPYFKKLQNELEKDLSHTESVIYQKVGRNFNLNSPKQLSQVLFEDLKLKPKKRRKTHYSTSYEVLVELAQTHDVPREMLKYRELAKLKSTYVDPLINLTVDSRLHTSFNQTGTATGRLSSSNPNIQNIPIRTDLGKRIRAGFVVEKGFKLISADYSQIELRILASLSGDQRLIEAFRSGEDIHTQTACRIFNLKPDKVSPFHRRIAKVVNYGIIYGMSEYGLAQELEIPQAEAQAFIENYKSIYPGVQEWIEQAITSATEKGYAETLFKRKRPLPDLRSQNRALVEFSRRAAINTPIQGTAADIIKLAMIKIYKLLKEKKFKGGLLLQIHDELLFEIEENRIDEAKHLIKEAMEKVVDLKAPVEVSIGVGQNWSEAH
ncbi:MAG: DNA polymerase I, partial [candidate division WOR-3 bacterium]